MPLVLTPETILLFLFFVTTIFILYRVFRLIVKASLIAGAAFAFPWIVTYLGLNLGFPITFETGLEFAILGFLLFFIYEFFHFILHILKFLTWPIRGFFKRKK